MPIKSYSPELIVYPILSHLNQGMLDAVLSRAHVLIVGPGLGRSEAILRSAERIFKKAQSLGVTCIVDGVSASNIIDVLTTVSIGWNIYAKPESGDAKRPHPYHTDAKQEGIRASMQIA